MNTWRYTIEPKPVGFKNRGGGVRVKGKVVEEYFLLANKCCNNIEQWFPLCSPDTILPPPVLFQMPAEVLSTL